MSRTRAHFRLSTTAGRRRVLPVRAWLQAGAAAAAVGFALAGAATASADDGTAARDSSSAAGDSSTQSRVSASSSAPRASAAQANSRVALAAAPKRVVQSTAPKRPERAVGKALFNDSGKVIQAPQNYTATPGQGLKRNVYLAINDPAFALWSKQPGTNLRTPEALRYAFPEWLREQRLPPPSYPNQADAWVKNTLTGVRPRLDASPLGVFTPAFPTVDNYLAYRDKKPVPAFTNGDGVAVTRFFGYDGGIEGRDANALPFNAGSRTRGATASWNAFSDLLSKLATITPQSPAGSGCATNRCNYIELAGGNDVVTPGWIGNAVINTGPGDDIILASPEVKVAVWSLTDSYQALYSRTEEGSRVYYPTPYALWGTGSNKLGNTFSGGTGNDLIYYDGSVAAAYGDDGNDILAPSFGSFNWAFDTLFQGSFNLNESERTEVGKSYPGFGPALALYLDRARSVVGGIGRGDTLQGVALVSGRNALLGPDTNLSRGESKDRLDRVSYWINFSEEFDRFSKGKLKINRLNIGLNSDPKSGETIIDTKQVNKLGGQDLYGGAGDDVIYGIDPDFYKGFQTAANGKGLRLAFNLPTKDGKVDGRQHAQVFQSVNMFGGAGSDYFSLGNPGNLEGLSPDLRSLYRISGNSDSWKFRDTGDFGVLEGDVFEANLTYQGNNWTSSVVGPDGTGGAATVGKVVKGGADAIKVVNDIGKVFDKDSPYFAIFAMPKLAAVASVVSFVTGLIQGYTPPPEEPIVEGALYSDPIGSWRKTIKIQDWDPADSISIRVDPSNSQSDPLERWNNVQLKLDNTKSTSGEGLYITYKLTGDGEERDLFLLENFTAKDNVDGAWWAWDFRQAGGQGAYVPITKDHLAFFGQVDPSKASVVTPYQDQYRFNVAAGSTLFRWTDEGLKNNLDKGLLSRLQSNSERIVIQLDTMRLGYHWDIQYRGDEASGPNSPITNIGVNEKTSKLWVLNPAWNSDAPDAVARWIGYSLEELEANPELAKLAKKATPVWANPGVDPNRPAT